MENIQIIFSLAILTAFVIWLVGVLNQKAEVHITTWIVMLTIWALLTKVLHIQNLTTSMLIIWWFAIVWYWFKRQFKL